MKVREKLMRKVMAVVIAAATIFSISGGTKVVPVKAAVEVAEVLDLNENLRGQYVLSPIRCKTLLDGGRRRTKNLYGVFKRTVPAGLVRQ